MKLKYRIYLLSLLTTFLASCVDDNLYSLTDKGTSPEEYEEGYTYFDAFVDNFSVRTRNIQFEEGSSVRVNSLWIGVFDINTGECVEKKETTQDYKFLTSGELARGVLRMKFDGPGSEYNGDGNFFMVAVANFKDVKARTSENAAEETDLSTLLENVADWDDFNDIGVETTSAYAGDHNLDSPVLAGFLNTTDAYSANVKSSTHIKINQFADPGTGMVQLLPATLPVSGEDLLESLAIRYNNSLKRYVDDAANAEGLNHTIFFRRLIANINVNIVTPENSEIQITDVSYRRFNIPKMVYIIERSMLDGEGKFPTDAYFSPNFADIYPESGYYKDDDNYKDLGQSSGGSNSSNGQFSESDNKNWLKDNVTPNDDGSWTFSFQHFANKHWARKTLTEYAEREKLNTDGSFDALAANKDDINNNASYFIVKMHLINPSKNRCSEAEYTIHEGYTSDSQGYDYTGNGNNTKYTETDWNKHILNDFSCARNINYTYNLRINSFENLLVNVNGSATSENETLHHRSDIGGKVWQFNYVNEPKDACNSISHNVHFDKSVGERGDFTEAISSEGGVFENAIRIDSDKPNLAFRLYGYNSDKDEIEGYNYNFPDNSFSWLNGLWPESAGDMSRYFQDYDALIGASEGDLPINDLLYSAFKIIEADKYKGTDSDEWMDIVGFIKSVHEATGHVDKTYHIKVAPRGIDKVSFDEKGNYVRALYIADRNGIVDTEDGCTTLVNIYAAVQDPPFYKTFSIDPVYKQDMYSRWKSTWNAGKSNAEELIHYVHTTANGNWTGSINGIVNLGFKINEDLGATQFRVDVKDNSETSLTYQVFDIEKIKKESDGYVEFPLKTNWNGVAPGTYTVTVTPENPNGSNESDRRTYSGKLTLYNSSWTFYNDSDWQQYTYTNAKNSLLNLSGAYEPRDGKSYTVEKNFFMEKNGFELGVFETHETTPFMNSGGYLNTMADYYPDTSSRKDYQPMKGKSYQVKFYVTKSGTISLKIKNSNTNEKYWRFEFGDNITVGSGVKFNGSNATLQRDGNVYKFNCTNKDAFQTLEIPVTVNATNSQDPTAFEVKAYTVKDVLHLQSVEFK